MELAREHDRYGYRMLTGQLNNAGWRVNAMTVERFWRREGVRRIGEPASSRMARRTVPRRQAKKGWLWLDDGSCVRLHPERPNHVRSYDFVQDLTHDGRAFRTLDSPP